MSEKEEFKHYPVMLKETIDGLNCRTGLIYVDATLGGGGHSREIAERILPNGRLISLDVDSIAIEKAQNNLKEFDKNVTIVNSNYTKIKEVLRNLNIEKITGGIVFDLGASYYQLTSAERGFSFSKNSKLDMRFDTSSDLTAYDVINSYSEIDLVRIFSDYGEERYSKRIAKAIVEKRTQNNICTTTELANIIKSATPPGSGKIHPATRVFQAIRIEVNNELHNIKQTLEEIIQILEIDARITVISFHSLEDRVVKGVFKKYSSNCNCPPMQMICSCEPKKLELINKKPITAESEEIKQNPPSRSAKLRIAKRV
ncbi:MAG: 16S rRNA (cytosine(1402)-N(4))-methyltransferase RsmH [Candidatus Gastranaerophilaceae bacterium]